MIPILKQKKLTKKEADKVIELTEKGMEWDDAVNKVTNQIENSGDCEYDCDEKECLSNGCPRFGVCVFTEGD